jgi:hypothetical protein
MPAAVDWSARYEHDKNAEPREGDGAIGEWSRRELAAMNAAFVERIERAFRTGSESKAAAAATRQPRAR